MGFRSSIGIAFFYSLSQKRTSKLFSVMSIQIGVPGKELNFRISFLVAMNLELKRKLNTERKIKLKISLFRDIT